MVIEAAGLTRRYGEFVAVDNASFNIGAGEVVGLLGHNGAGKTTIMKMLTGFIEPSAGVVKVDGVDVQRDALAVQAKMGYLPENSPLYPELTVLDYLSYAAQLRGLDPAACVRQAVQATRLEEKATQRIDTLSRGYKQRVGVAQAILHHPKILILDEPTNGLDPEQIQQMRALIKDLSSQATVILSTHILQEVDAVCDRAIILRAGEVVVDERLDALQRSDALRVATAPGADIVSCLSSIEQVQRTTDLGAGQWRLEVTGDLNTAAAAVAQALVAGQLPVYELAPLSQDLETIFKQVNQMDTVEAEHAA